MHEILGSFQPIEL